MKEKTDQIYWYILQLHISLYGTPKILFAKMLRPKLEKSASTQNVANHP